MKCIVIRHGETQMNHDHILMGQTYDVPLDERGRLQVQEVAQSLPHAIDIILSSPMKRTLETADIIAKSCGVPIETLVALKERDFGTLSGDKDTEAFEEMREHGVDPNEFRGHFNFHKFGGESFDDVKTRLVRCTEHIKEHYGDKQVLIVTHAGIIRVLYELYMGTTPQVIKNASVHVLEF